MSEYDSVHWAYTSKDSPAFMCGLLKVYRVAKKMSKKLTKANCLVYLQRIATYTKSKPVIRKFPRNKLFSPGVGYRAHCDIGYMDNFTKQNRGYPYILLLVDVFSRFVHAIPIKKLTSDATIDAFKQIFKTGRRYSMIMTDAGTNFISKKTKQFYRKNFIQHVTLGGQHKSVLAEIFNKHVKRRLILAMEHLKTKKWLDLLPVVINVHNNEPKDYLNGLSPAEVNIDNEELVIRKQDNKGHKKPKFAIGQYVRIALKKGAFTREYSQHWSDKIYKIVSITGDGSARSKYRYRIKEDAAPRCLKRAKYESELSRFIP